MPFVGWDGERHSTGSLLAVIALAALNGLRRGLVAGALSLGGIVVGGVSRGEAGAAVLLGRRVGLHAARRARRRRTAGGRAPERRRRWPARRSARACSRCRRYGCSTLGGVLLGAATGVALVWVAGAVALHVPGQTELREEVQRSRVLGEINERVPPSRLLDAIARVDPFARIAGPQARVAPPDPELLRDPGVRRARASVLRVTGKRVRPRRSRARAGSRGRTWSSRTPTSSPG